MQLDVGQALLLVDRHRAPLGRITLDQHDKDLLAGRFEPEAGFAAVESLFRRFEQAANAQSLSVIDQLDQAIAALGLQLSLPGQTTALPIHDVQVWIDGSMSCRLCDSSTTPLNSGIVNQQAPAKAQ